MTYHLGVDLGTTFTAAGVAHDGGAVVMASLGDHGTAIPSVVLLREDGEWLVGDAAVRRAAEKPDRVVREAKRRVGDPVPVVVGGAPFAAELLMARTLRWVVDRVATHEGAWPSSIVVTHPASWGTFKLDLLRSGFASVGVEVTRLVPEPVAAATAYAAERPLPVGALVAVYDLGGGTFDACVVRRDESGFAIVGRPEGIERLGGIDIDEAVFAHVRQSLGPALDELDGDDPTNRAALVALRRECTAAKEALSADNDASVTVLLPTVRTAVRITRPELEAMVRPTLTHTVEVLRRTITSAGIGPEHLHAVLLVGGSSRIPLVAQVVGADLGRPVVVDAHPKDVVALGAARVGRDAAAPAAAPAPVTPPAPTPPPPPAPEPPVAMPPPAPARKSRRGLVAAAVIVAVLAIAGVAIALQGGDDPDDEVSSGDTTTTEAPGETTTSAVDDTTTTAAPAGGFAGITEFGPEAEAAFVASCVEGGGGAAFGDDVENACRCVYRRFEEEFTFEEFVAANTEQVDDPTAIDPRVQQFILDCAFEA